MKQKQAVILICILIILIFTGCASPEKKFCCGSFSEDTGKTSYFWSDDEMCGTPINVACAGSCPSVRDEEYCS